MSAPEETPADSAGRIRRSVAVPPLDAYRWQLSAETITVRIRWFGLCVGYLLVNALIPGDSRPVLNGILTLGAVYTLLDTLFSAQGRIFLVRLPLSISLMESLFIGLLCHFHTGLESPFRFYYFLSLLACAMRYSPAVTYSTLGLHAVSYTLLAINRGVGREGGADVALMLVFMAWVTWASTALAGLLKSAGERLSQLNHELRDNQRLLEHRIADRTRQLQESQAMLVQQEKQAAFGLLAAGIAHEVGNPLAAISALVQMMNRRELDSYMHERLFLVDEQLIRIQKTLRELVEFSRPGSTNVQTCDLHTVIDSALSIAKYYKRKKGKTIVTRYAEGLPEVSIIRDRIQQVFLNLILNALDATEEGANIEITTEWSGARIAVTIRDEGSGIEPAAQMRLFTPYFTTKTTGTGLGLFVCRNILQDSGGTIELVESSPQGTTFRVELPSTPRAASVPSAAATELPAAAPVA
jgi:two-component system NtrC family sensor kinase